MNPRNVEGIIAFILIVFTSHLLTLVSGRVTFVSSLNRQLPFLETEHYLLIVVCVALSILNSGDVVRKFLREGRLHHLIGSFFIITASLFAASDHYQATYYLIVMVLIGVLLLQSISLYRASHCIQVFVASVNRGSTYVASQIPPKVAVALFALAGVMWYLYISANVFHHQPYSVDTECVVRQAEVFARGELFGHNSVNQPPSVHCIVNKGSGFWYSKYPPGQAFLLSLGSLFGMPWVINPLLGAANIFLIGLIGINLYGPVAGIISSFLALVCPMSTLLASEYISHVSALTMLLLALYFLVRFCKKESFYNCFLVAFFIGAASIIRPLPSLASGLVFVILVAKRVFTRDIRTKIVCAIGLFTGVLPWVICFGIFNYAVTGEYTLFGYSAANNLDRMGFGFRVDGYYSLLDGLRNTILRLGNFNLNYLGPPLPLAAMLYAWWIIPTKDQFEYIMVSCFLLLVVLHIAYWGNDNIYGPRYYYEAGSGLLIIIGRTLEYWGTRAFAIAYEDKMVCKFVFAAAFFVWLYCLLNGHVIPYINFYATRW